MNAVNPPIRRAGHRHVVAGRTLALLVVCVTTLALVGAGCTPAPAPKPRRPVASKAVSKTVERTIVFPVARTITFSDTFGDPRGGGTRSHAGQDLMAPKMTPLVAAVNGRVKWLRWSNAGNAGNMLVLVDKDGWEYWYLHINNDTPGTDDAANPYNRAFAKGIKAGVTVKAGQTVAWVGDSGNAESSGSHLHFEMHRPDGSVVNPYKSLVRAKARQ